MDDDGLGTTTLGVRGARELVVALGRRRSSRAAATLGRGGLGQGGVAQVAAVLGQGAARAGRLGRGRPRRRRSGRQRSGRGGSGGGPAGRRLSRGGGRAGIVRTEKK